MLIDPMNYDNENDKTNVQKTTSYSYGTKHISSPFTMSCGDQQKQQNHSVYN